jgi:hypothetical protein
VAPVKKAGNGEKFERAIAIVERMWKDGIDSQEHQRNAQQKRHYAGRGHFFIEQVQKYAPGKQGCQAAGRRCVNDVVEIYPAR